MPRRTSAKPKQSAAPEVTIWTPQLFGRQIEIFNCRKRVLLVCGSRKAGKSWAICHRICRHLWETPGASIGFFAKSVKLAKDGGMWQDLLSYGLPEWIASGIVGQTGQPFEITTIDSSGNPGPKQDAQTRTAYFRIRNMYGGESECKLFSIEHDHEVGSKVHSKRFSMIFFSELWMFKDKKVLAATLPALRMPHLMPQPGQPDLWHQWMADTNPDPELGCKSWFYDVWYKERLDPNHKYPKVRDNLELIEMFIEDNPYATDYDREELATFCAGDDCLYDSYVRGVHGEGASKRDRFFAGVFDKTVHVIGNAADPDEDQIDVHASSDILLTGWDLGGRNHAACILEPWFRTVETLRGPVVRACFSVLDELLVLGEAIGLDDFTVEFMRKMEKLEDKTGRTDLKWLHFSDDSATTVWRPSSQSYDCMEIEAASGGKIILKGVSKPAGSVEARVRIIKQLLRQKRLWISARCEYVIEMILNLRRGDTDREYVMGDKYKHMFDALTYPLYVRVIDELLDNADPRASSKKVDDYSYIGID